MGITLYFSSPYQNNTYKRTFKMVRDFLNTFSQDKNRTDWTKLIPEITFKMSATVQNILINSCSTPPSFAGLRSSIHE